MGNQKAAQHKKQSDTMVAQVLNTAMWLRAKCTEPSSLGDMVYEHSEGGKKAHFGQPRKVDWLSRFAIA